MMGLDFFAGKTVLVTGHTGFKGAWLTRILLNAGANVVGYALEPPTSPSLFELSGMSAEIDSTIADIRDFEKLSSVFKRTSPEVVIHLAAQPLVLEGYNNPRYTYETNVMGTVNVLECARLSDSVRSFLNVTTDKVYQNNEWCWGYRETDALDGHDPYSNSKSCSELVTHSYSKSFFSGAGAVPVSTARAGNVIGGGDFADNRIIPDCVRAMVDDEAIVVRNPNSTRPYQHVLEPLAAYLRICERQSGDCSVAGSYNIGPDESDCVTTRELVEMFCREWGPNARWEAKGDANAPHEANFLRLDCSKFKSAFGWQPKWKIAKGMEMTCRFYKAWIAGDSIADEMDAHIGEYFS